MFVGRPCTMDGPGLGPGPSEARTGPERVTREGRQRGAPPEPPAAPRHPAGADRTGRTHPVRPRW